MSICRVLLGIADRVNVLSVFFRVLNYRIVRYYGYVSILHGDRLLWCTLVDRVKILIFSWEDARPLSNILDRVNILSLFCNELDWCGGILWIWLTSNLYFAGC
jgi:hypothetical protein